MSQEWVVILPQSELCTFLSYKKKIYARAEIITSPGLSQQPDVVDGELWVRIDSSNFMKLC